MLDMFTSLWFTCNSATSRCQTRSDVRIARRAWTRADGPSAYSRANGARYGRICTGPAEGEVAARGTWPSPGSCPPMTTPPRSPAPSSDAWSVSRSPPHIWKRSEVSRRPVNPVQRKGQGQISEKSTGLWHLLSSNFHLILMNDIDVYN